MPRYESDSGSILYKCIVFSKNYFGDLLFNIGISELAWSACHLIGICMSFRSLS